MLKIVENRRATRLEHSGVDKRQETIIGRINRKKSCAITAHVRYANSIETADDKLASNTDSVEMAAIFPSEYVHRPVQVPSNSVSRGHSILDTQPRGTLDESCTFISL